MKFVSLLYWIAYWTTVLVVFPFLAITVNTYYSLPVYRIFPLQVIGFFCITIGVSVYVYCWTLFLKLGKGTPVPTNAVTTLITNGIYARTRNPIYLCLLIIVLGLFFLFGHVMLLVYLLCLFVWLNIYVKYFEEPPLKDKFGKAYEAYMRQTPRWL